MWCPLCVQLPQRQPSSEDETMVPVLTSKRASELPISEAACVLQVRTSDLPILSPLLLTLLVAEH